MDDDREGAGDTPDHQDTRTDAWYWTRMELGLGIGLVVLSAASILFEPGFVGADEPPPSHALLDWVGFLGVVVGVALMIRILRGTRDEPPPWRYRDR